MRFAFVNNFEQILAAGASDTDTTITLDGGGAQMSDASADLVYILTLFKTDSEGNETAREIVHVTGVSGDTLTVTRAQEGTTAAAWAVGDGVSQRLTAEGLGGFMPDNPRISVPGSGEGPIEIGYGTSVFVLDETDMYLADTVLIGVSAQVLSSQDYQGRGVALGYQAEIEGTAGTALGSQTEAGIDAVAVGSLSDAKQDSGVAIGHRSAAASVRAVAIGKDAFVTSGCDNAVAMGYLCETFSGAPDSVSIGREARSGVNQGSGQGAVALGAQARGYSQYGVAIGYRARVDVPGGCRVNALPYIPATYGDLDAMPNATRQAGSCVVISTDPLELTDAAAFVELALPAGTMLFIDSIDVVITGSDTPGGAPEITVGPDDVTPAAYLASTPVTKTAVGGRESHPPIVADGVSSLRVATSVAGSGTTYQAKIVFRGYVMEL